MTATSTLPGAPSDSRASTSPRAHCAVHPARPAADSCPKCGRPRCGVDAARWVEQCEACVRRAASRDRLLEGGPRLPRLTAAALVATAIGLLAGIITSEYVQAGGFGLIAPALAGLATGAGAAAAGRTTGRGRFDLVVRSAAAGYALLGTILAFRLVPGGQDPFGPAGTVIPPYLCAVAGAYASRLVR